MKRNPYLDSDEYDDGINWNPSSHFEEEQLYIAHQSMQIEDMENAKKRQSHKNKYIKKITLIKPEETANTKKRSLNHSDHGFQPEELKKIKNREAAKESRQRKKLYINLIEEQTKKLEKEIEMTNKQIENCKFEIQKCTFLSNQSIGVFDSKLVHVFKKIEGLLANEESEEKDNEINLAIDSLIYRFGAAGKERKSHISQSYRQIKIFAFSPVHRYILWAAKQKAHLFSDNKESSCQQWFKDMKEILGDKIAQCQKFIETRDEIFSYHYQDFSQVGPQLIRTKDQIQQFSNMFDSMFVQIRDILTPTQFAKLILLIQRSKYRQQLRFMENQKSMEQQFLHPTKRYLKIEEQSR